MLRSTSAGDGNELQRPAPRSSALYLRRERSPVTVFGDSGEDIFKRCVVGSGMSSAYFSDHQGAMDDGKTF